MRPYPLLLLMLLATPFAQSQTVQPPMPRDYAGVQSYIPGIFVTPVANAPFTAKVEITSRQRLPDGTFNTRTTVNHIARQSSGRIYNERRQLVTTNFKGEPALLSAHIYDPSSGLNIFLNPYTRLARESILRQPPPPPANAVPAHTPAANPLYKEEELGTQPLGSVTLRGIRKTRIIPADASTTGQQITIVDEYWYSPDLSIYMIIKHEDPRTGEQIVAVSEVERLEPETTRFTVPANYKVVDENPVN